MSTKRSAAHHPTRTSFVVLLAVLASVLGGAFIFAAALLAPANAVASSSLRAEQLELEQFKEQLDHIVQEHVKARDAEHVSLYFLDLAAGPGFELEPEYRFAPASLMKVPVMMALLKQAESDPGLLASPLTYSGTIDSSADQGIKPAQRLEPGQTYSVDELLRRMIAYSDNNALVLLMGRLDSRQLDNLMHTLQIDYEPTTDGGRVSLKSYSVFFRTLYAGTYLSPAMNERALGYLKQDAFTAGLLSGIPAGTPVAGKFGEWAFGSHSEIRQLQEVAIVYHGNRPYLLGIAVQGRDMSRLTRLLGELSHAVYGEAVHLAQRPS